MSSARPPYLSSIWKEGIFDRKVVFCTGGNGDICSGQVRAMVYLGANACIIGRNVEKTTSVAHNIMEVRKGSKVLALGGIDVRDYDALAAAAKRCSKELGSIDFVIVGAAGNFVSRLDTLSSRAFKAVVDIDLVGSFHTLKATLPYLKQSAAAYPATGAATSSSGTGGRIIFISAATYYQGAALQAHACAAKAGVDALSSCVAIECGPYGLTSNILAPGPIDGTEGLKRLARLEGYSDSISTIPSGRYGSFKDIADATIYLFSDAGSYVNGATLVVDGGAWRTQGANNSTAYPYPQFLLNEVAKL